MWSPDSKKIATFQQDQRDVGEMYLVDTKVGHPTLQAWKYPLPGDAVVTMIQRVVIDVDARQGRPPADAARPAPLDALRRHRLPRPSGATCSGARTARTLAFVSTSRDHKREQLRVADAATGEVRDVLEEKVADASTSRATAA